MTEFKAYSKMKELMTNYYIEAKTTQEKPIAWVTSGAPVEFLYAMDILPIYPENYAAMCAAGHQSVELMEAAEALVAEIKTRGLDTKQGELDAKILRKAMRGIDVADDFTMV